jgi:hypothetical protein
LVEKLISSYESLVAMFLAHILGTYLDSRDPGVTTIYMAGNQMKTIDESGQLDGGDVLPGFMLRIGELFERAECRRGE